MILFWRIQQTNKWSTLFVRLFKKLYSIFTCCYKKIIIILITKFCNKRELTTEWTLFVYWILFIYLFFIKILLNAWSDNYHMKLRSIKILFLSFWQIFIFFRWHVCMFCFSLIFFQYQKKYTNYIHLPTKTKR